MAIPQTSVSVTPTLGKAGLIADMNPNNDVRSYVNGESSAEIPFGVMVAQGTADEEARLCTTGDTSPLFVGVHVYNPSAPKPYVLGDTGIKINMSMGVMQKGVIWVPVEEAVTPASAVLVRIIAEGSEVAGAFRDTADASDCIDISAWARFVSSTTGAGLAQLQFDVTMRKEKAGD